MADIIDPYCMSLIFSLFKNSMWFSFFSLFWSICQRQIVSNPRSRWWIFSAWQRSIPTIYCINRIFRRTFFGMHCKSKRAVLISGRGDLCWKDDLNTCEEIDRRSPHTGHNINGYEGSLQSFYLSICDVSPYFFLLWLIRNLTMIRNKSCRHSNGHER